LGLRGTRKDGNGENYIMRSFMTCTPHQILFKLEEMGWACGTYGKTGEVRREFGGKTPGEELLGKSRRRWKYNIKMDFQVADWGRNGVD